MKFWKRYTYSVLVAVLLIALTPTINVNAVSMRNITGAPSQQSVKNAITWADMYIDKGYKGVYGEATYACMMEYPSMPFSIYINDIGRWHHAGNEDWNGLWYSAYCSITTISDNGQHWHGTYGFEDCDPDAGDYTDWDYNEPVLEVWFDCNVGSGVLVTIKVQSYQGVRNVDVYFGTTLLWSNVAQHVGEQKTQWCTGDTACFPSNRYTIRHGNMLGKWHYGLDRSNTARYSALRNFAEYHGFYKDIYEPMWAKSSGYDDNYFFVRSEAYHDTVMDWENGFMRRRNAYAYRSKITINPDLYIWESHFDPLILALRAIHATQKYGSPYAKDSKGHTAMDYLRNGFYCYDTMTWVNSVEWYWDNNGITYFSGGYSSIRLTVFTVAEALVGYGFGDTTSKAYADRGAELLTLIQWLYWGNTQDYGQIWRPDHNGGMMIAYKIGSYYLPSKGWLSQFLDMFNMAPEFPTCTPTNMETTINGERALRVYYWYKWKGGTGCFPSNLSNLW